MNQTETKISNHIQAIKHFIEKMDIEMVNVFLDNDKKYHGIEKYLFISKLQKAFETFIDRGDTQLFAVEGSCNSCYKIKNGYTFIGNNTNNYMSIIFDMEGNKIKDLSECRNFKSKQTNLNLKERIYIDNNVSIPF